MLAQERCLAITVDHNGTMRIYSDHLLDLKAALTSDRNKKRLASDKIGKKYLIAFDENKRMLVVCTVENVSTELHKQSPIVDGLTIILVHDTYVSIR